MEAAWRGVQGRSDAGEDKQEGRWDILDLVAVQALSLGSGLGCGVRWIWVREMGEHAGGVREQELWTDKAPVLGREDWIQLIPSPASWRDQGSVGMRTAGGVWEG